MNPNNDYFPFGIYDVQWSQMVSFWAGLWHWLYHITFTLVYYEHYLAITIYSSLLIFGENSLMNITSYEIITSFSSLKKIPVEFLWLADASPSQAGACAARRGQGHRLQPRVVARRLPDLRDVSAAGHGGATLQRWPGASFSGLAHHGRPWEKWTQQQKYGKMMKHGIEWRFSQALFNIGYSIGMTIYV